MAWGVSVGAFAALALAISGAASDSREGGHLQVKAAAGVMIEVGARHAIVQDMHGVSFLDMAPGAHRLVARKQGYVTQHALIWVRPGEVTVHRLAPWQRQVGTRGTAAIVVQTLPVDATVSAQALGYEKIAKGDDDLVISHVPPGRHKLTFCTSYKCIDYRAEVEDGDLVKLLVLFEPGVVQDKSETFRARYARVTQSCLRTRDADDCTESCTLATRLGIPSSACRLTTAEDIRIAERPSPEDLGPEIPAGSSLEVPDLPE